MVLLKRIFDITISFVIFLLTLPFLIVFSILLWFIHKENPFFLQKRIGKNSKPFTIIKLKTQSKLTNQHNSDFIKYLQKTHIDELPQLVNVLLGNMSIVGPRPHTPEHVMQYEDWQKERLAVKPGITCLRQLKDPYKKIMFNTFIEYDIKYIHQWSFWLDIKILLRTLLAFVKILLR